MDLVGLSPRPLGAPGTVYQLCTVTVSQDKFLVHQSLGSSQLERGSKPFPGALLRCCFMIPCLAFSSLNSSKLRGMVRLHSCHEIKRWPERHPGSSIAFIVAYINEINGILLLSAVRYV